MSTTKTFFSSLFSHEVLINVMGISLWGRLFLPETPRGIILQVHCNTPNDALLDAILAEVQQSGFAVLTINLSCFNDHPQAGLSSNVPALTERLLACLAWVNIQPLIHGLPCALVALEEGVVPAAIRAGVQRDAQVRALVCLKGFPDQAGRFYLDNLQCPTLVVVGAQERRSQASMGSRLPGQIVTEMTTGTGDGEEDAMQAVEGICQWLCTHAG